MEADIICFIEKPPAALAGISRRKNESKESGEVACCGRFSCCTHKLPGRTRSLRGGENGRISDSRTCDPEGSGSGQAVSDGDGICRRTGRAAGNCGNGKRQLVRYAGDRADVSRSGKYFKAGSGDQECER